MARIRASALLLLAWSALSAAWANADVEGLEAYGMGPEDGSGLCDSRRMEREAIAERAVRALTDTGDFYVIRGNLTFNKVQIGNPVGKYGTVRFPHWAFPPFFCDLSRVPTNGSQPPFVFSFCDLSFTLGPRDAIVWLGCTPPPAAYFSIRSYVAFRFKPSLWFAAAELGDPANQLTINTTGEGDTFSKTTLVISTGDGETERQVREAFVSGGMPGSAVNVDVLPEDLVHFRDRSHTWARDRSDGLAWQFRVSEPRDQLRTTQYFQTAWPAYLIRAKRHYNRAKPEPLKQLTLRPRGTGEDERGFSEPLDALAKRAVKRMEAEGAKLVGQFPMTHNIPDLDHCLSDPHFMPIFEPVPEWGFPGLPTCDWFTRALYTLISRDKADPNLLYFPPNRVWVVLGVNQPLVRKAVYSNFMLTCIKRFEQPEHSFNLTSAELAGSGSALASDVPSSDKLFAYTFRRSCPAADRFCRAVPEAAINFTEPIFFVERKYLEEATKIGPAPEEVLPPILLAFDLPANASSAGFDFNFNFNSPAAEAARARLRGVVDSALTAQE